MEYLITYGWAILIIAIVLVALFSLGVFNSANFAPKASPGSCQVFRPNGPGTAFDLNLEGECNGELPQYVAQFNWQTPYINILSSAQISPTKEIDVFAWIYINSPESAIVGKEGLYGMKVGVNGAAPGQFAGYVWGTSGVCSSFPFSLKINTWYFVGFTFDGNTIYEYVNGNLYCKIPFYGGIDTSTSPLVLGGPNDVDGNVNGSISNLQIYNGSISNTTVSALYSEGIGGAPIDLQNIVGWWPLNGNANDYSGNENNGAATNVIYTTSWTNGYTAP